VDRDIDINERRRKTWSRLIVAGIVVVLAVVSVVFAADFLKPSVHRARVRFATVERGDFEATVQASGTVVPASERVLSSPAETRVLSVLRRPGERVAAGEPILRLDTSQLESRLESVEDKLAQSASQQTQANVQFENKRDGYQSDIQIQELDLEISRYRLNQRKRLEAHGLISEEERKQFEVEVRRCEIRVERLRVEIEAARRTHEADLERLELDAELLRKDRAEARRQLDRATTRSPIDGVLTWAIDEVGSTVAAGAIIARVADLRSFRIEARVSDAYAGRLESGQTVRVKTSDGMLDATLTTILPTIESGAMQFEVDLAEPDNPALRHNMRVDVLVVTDRREDVLRIRRGPFIQSGGMTHRVFVVDGDRAHRTEIDLGLSGHEYYEVRSGLEEGDEVILSDMRTYLHARELRIK
jgi:HlyD family secretion protein